MTDVVYTILPPRPPSPQPSILRKPASTGEAINKIEAESLVSEGPQRKIHTTSKWGVGWRTLLIMAVSYIIALLITFAHLGLFWYLDTKPAEGLHRVAPQSYISTASNILSNAFAFSLKASLAIAFTQYLWYILRQAFLKVSTIESLFQIRSNPFVVFDRLVVANGVVLVIIAIIMWSIQIAASFPPGALTITLANRTWTQTMNIPTFNASFYGNGSGYDAERYSFDGFSYLFDDNSTIYPSSNGTGILTTPFVKNLATHTLINGMPSTWASPCGANCSFTLTLDVPYLECNSSAFSNFNFSGTIPDGDTFDYPLFTATWVDYMFNVTTYNHTSWQYYTDLQTSVESWTVQTQGNNIICSPARVNYSLDFLYENNIQNMSISIGVVTPLDIQSPAPPTPSNPTYPPGAVDFPGFIEIIETSDVFTIYFMLEALNWTTPFVSWYRDLQLMALIDGLADSLAGDVISGLSYAIDTPEGTGIYRVAPIDNGTVATNTRFNEAYGIYAQHIPSTTANNDAAVTASNKAQTEVYLYNVTQELLNQVLLNITLSAITDFGWWETDGTEVTQWDYINVYSFSRPLNIILPYFLTLALSLPFLVMGAFALYQNGVPAADGGFAQLVATSMGSAELKKLATGGCLGGGSESMPKELMELKIRFGELVTGENVGVRRAGFGTENETEPLKKGVLYGSS